MSRVATLILVVAVSSSAAFAQTGSSQPNIFGGYNYRSSDGYHITATPNIFGGYNYIGSDGMRITSQPNIFGGMNFRTNNGWSGSSIPNVFGGYDLRYTPPMYPNWPWYGR